MHPDAIVLKFLDIVEADLAGSGLRGLEDYVARFPGHEELIDTEYRKLAEPQANAASQPSHQRIGERYLVLESLGRGSFGEVFLAEDSHLDRRVAIKVLGGIHALSDEWRTRLVREAEATNRISDDGLCPIYDVGFEAGSPFLVMPWIPGRSLDRAIAATAARGEGPVDLGDHEDPLVRLDAFLLLVERVARTLHSAHEAGVVHRDVKPANMIVRPDGKPVLIDFGLAWLASTDAPSHTAAFGTPAYAAPEVLRGGPIEPDPRLDVWSLGAVLFEGLALRRPFAPRPGVSLERCILEDPTPRIDAPFGRDLQAVVETALARDPADRYPTMAAFADDVGSARRGEPVSARPAGRIRRLRAWARSRPRTVTAIAGLIALVSAIAVVGTLGWRHYERELTAHAVAGLAESIEEFVHYNEQLAPFGLAIHERAATAERLSATTRNLRTNFGPGAEIDRCLARVAAMAGTLHLQLGRVALGTQRVEEALALRRSLVAPGPHHDEDRAGIAHALILLGDSRSHVDKDRSALALYLEAFDIDAALLAEQPGHPKRVSDVGFGHLRIGLMLRRLGQAQPALQRQQQAVTMLRRAEELEPERTARRDHTAIAMLETLNTMESLERPRSEIKAMLDEVEPRVLARAESRPLDSSAWERLGNTAALRRRMENDPTARLAAADRVLEYAQRASDLQPNAPYPLAGLSSAHRERAAILAELDRFDEAAESIDVALELIARAADMNPQAGAFVSQQINGLLIGARIATLRGDSPAAEQLRLQAMDVLKNEWRRKGNSSRTLMRLGSRWLHPDLGQHADPEHLLALIEDFRATGEELGHVIRDLEKRARAMLR